MDARTKSSLEIAGFSKHWKRRALAFSDWQGTVLVTNVAQIRVGWPLQQHGRVQLPAHSSIGHDHDMITALGKTMTGAVLGCRLH
jgi:hypothetical protein